MVKFVPYDKMSKKEKRAIDIKKRKTWGTISPATQCHESKKNYKRKKDKAINLLAEY